MRFLLFLLMITGVCWSSIPDYSLFSSLEEVIAYEECRIENEELKASALADAYADLGESYLLQGSYGKALEVLKLAVEIDELHSSQDGKVFSRALLALSITYANMDLMEEFYWAIQALKESFHVHSCLNLPKTGGKPEHVLLIAESSEILGPDRIPVRSCVEAVNGTVAKANELISFVKRPEVQFLLRMTIDELADESRRCCIAGGLWKACVKPLVDKWYICNQKWKLFGIPPDPAWD